MKQRIGWILLGAGCLIRLIVFLQNRSIHMDAANLARNIIEKDIASFFQPLDYQQYAPPLFLVWEKLHTLLLGNNEYALRLLPLLSGCLLLWFWWKTSGALKLSWAISLVGLWLLAFSPFQIRYSTEVKQYATDAAVAMGLLLLATRIPLGKLHALGQIGTPRRWISWMLIGSLAIWGSMPSIFVLTGVGGYYLWQLMEDYKATTLRYLLMIGAVWLASFALYYFTVLKADLGNEALSNYHQAYFLPLLPSSGEQWWQWANIFRSLLRHTFGFTTLAIASGGLGLLLGGYALWQNSRAHFFLLALPVLSCLLASGLGYYSLIPRLTLFLLPILLLFYASGLQFLWENLKGYWKIVLLALVLPCLVLQTGFRYALQPLETAELRPLLAYLKRSYQPDQLVLITDGAAPAYYFYSNLHDRKADFQFEHTYIASWDEWPVHVLERTGAFTERWLVFSHLISAGAEQKKSQWLEEGTAQNNQLLRSIDTEGASVVLLKQSESN